MQRTSWFHQYSLTETHNLTEIPLKKLSIPKNRQLIIQLYQFKLQIKQFYLSILLENKTCGNCFLVKK